MRTRKPTFGTSRRRLWPGKGPISPCGTVPTATSAPRLRRAGRQSGPETNATGVGCRARAALMWL
jgi:hypothetical protein